MLQLGRTDERGIERGKWRRAGNRGVTYADPFGLACSEKLGLLAGVLCQAVQATFTAIGTVGGLAVGGGGGFLLSLVTGGANLPAVPAEAIATTAAGAGFGLAAGQAVTNVLFSQNSGSNASGGEHETPQDKRIHTRGIEVGQVFYFGEKYSKPMQALITGADGVERPFQGGSYGVGVSRLVGALIEANHDENGIIWPESVAPFKVGLANLKVGDGATDAACASIYGALEKAGLEVLYEDTDERPGAKFAKLDLIGLPYQLLVGPKGLASGTVELKTRATGARETLDRVPVRGVAWRGPPFPG